MVDQPKDEKSYSDPKSPPNVYQKQVSPESSQEVSKNSESNERNLKNDSCQPPLIYVNSSYEKPLEPPIRMTIPNPKRTLLPLDKPSTCDICGKKFARVNQYQQHRKSHFPQSGPAYVNFPIPVDDKSFSLQNVNNPPSPSAHCSNSTPPYLDIHKMAVEQMQAVAAASEKVDNELDQKFDSSTDPYLVSLASTVPSSQPSSSSPPREAFFYSHYPSTIGQRNQHFGSESAAKHAYSNSTSLNFKSHHNTDCGESEKPFICEICHKTFARRDTLICHQRTHDGTKPFRCKVCDKCFSRRDKLQCHNRVHSGERPYPCTVCGRAFAQSDKLKCHMRTHTGERPHPCDMCDKRFARRDTLHCHRRTHTGEKPFSCVICAKQFARRDRLTCHKRVHSGEKPYHCETCGKQFARSDKLYRHKQTHNIDRPLILQNEQSVNINKDHSKNSSASSLVVPLMTSNHESAINAGMSLPDTELSSKIHFPQQGLPSVFPTVKDYSTVGNVVWQTIY